MQSVDAVVSSDKENLILVNSRDEAVGVLPKIDCHLGEGVLHRAFSIFIFNDSGELLLQKRSGQKLLWPLYWSNTCCSHPREGERIEEAVNRRLEQELGFTAELSYLYKFEYKAEFQGKGTEHELCYVFVGQYSGGFRVNINEIAEWRFVSPENLDKELVDSPEKFTPWMKMEWEKLKTDFSQHITASRK